MRRSATTTALTRCISASTENRLVFDIRREDGKPVIAHLLVADAVRRIVKDYFMICDSYYEAIRTATPDRIEAIDMGRRGLHDEGSQHPAWSALKRKVEDRFRHRAPAVHADLRAALEGLIVGWPRSAASRSGAVRLRAQFGALADGGRAVQADLGGAIYVASAGVRKGELDPFAVAAHGRGRHRHRAAPADDLRGAGGLGGAEFRPDRHAVARGAPQGAGADAHASRPRSNTGRPPIRPRSKARASSGSTPIGRCATS